MYYLIGAVFTSCVLYWLVQKKEEREREQKGGSKVLVFFFLLIVTTCLFYFLGNAFGGSEKLDIANAGGSDYVIDMVKNIREDVIVGLPPFAAHGGCGDE